MGLGKLPILGGFINLSEEEEMEKQQGALPETGKSKFPACSLPCVEAKRPQHSKPQENG